MKFLRAFFGTLFVFSMLLVAGYFISSFCLKKSVPSYQENFSLPGLKSECRIIRDPQAVPKIIASNQEDAAFALGFVHAEDRLFQMDLMRRAAFGRMSEVFGEKTVAYDEMFRTMGLGLAAFQAAKNLDPLSEKILAAYSRGVNSYINTSRSKYPVEFDVLGYDPEEWRPEDCIAVMKLYAWQMNNAWSSYMVFHDLVEKFGTARAGELYPLPAGDLASESFHISTSLAAVDRSFRNFIGQSSRMSSSGWALAPGLSASGHPMVAGAMRFPCAFYAALIRSPEWRSDGLTVPGIPAVIIGKNKNISWVLSNLSVDNADFYRETLDASGKNYLVDGIWRPLSERYETIKIKHREPEVLKVLSTYRGPLVSGIHSAPGTVPVSMRWTGLESSDNIYSFLEINRASNFGEFSEALRNYAVPVMNYIYADRQGNFGSITAGKIPLRNTPDVPLIADGKTSIHDWAGFLDFSQMPRQLNPSEGFVSCANDSVPLLRGLWEPRSRIDRIRKLLSRGSRQSLDDFAGYQADVVSLYAKEMGPYILDAFSKARIMDRNLSLSLELLRAWDFRMERMFQAPAIYSVFYNRLLENIYKDKMDAGLYREFVYSGNIPLRATISLMKNPSSYWFDDPKTSVIEDRDYMIRKSFNDALNDLEGRFGKDPALWQWGLMHHFVMVHPLSLCANFLGRLLDIGPYEVSGSGTTVDNSEYDFAESYDTRPGADARFLFDFSCPGEFRFILPGGQSGNPMSPHYRDMTDLYLQGRLLRVRDDAFESPDFKQTRLIPL